MKIPNHVAIIMDGNGRWGLKHHGSRIVGHNYGSKNIKNIIKNFVKLRIKNLSLYSLSTDNLNKRSKKEIENIFKLFEKNIKENTDFFYQNKINLRIVGETNNLPDKIKRIIFKTNNKFFFKKSLLNLNIAFNYSSRREMINAFKKLTMKNIPLNEKKIKENLYFYLSGDPEIIIRTGGKRRISDFMLWQSAYSEFFFLNKLWPDFNISDLKKILKNFEKIKRNFGK